MDRARVSIPYSSGHLFRSLALGSMPRAKEMSLNPLFIRSSIPFLGWDGTPGRIWTSLNPLFIRSSIPLFNEAGKQTKRSGSQSLIHQVIYSVAKSRRWSSPDRSRVSIPYSSGHLFRFHRQGQKTLNEQCSLNPLFIRSSIPFLHLDELGLAINRSLNPLFIRSSIPFRQVRAFIQKRWATSQSLIHQVIYSVSWSHQPERLPLVGLNPLFIRSSIPLSSLGGREGRCPVRVSIPYSSGHLFRFH